MTSYTSDVTNAAIQSPSLNGFIGTNYISIQKVQRQLRQVTSGAWQSWKNAALQCLGPEVESSRTSLASRTHFEVLGLGLEASSPRKLPCPRLENSTIFKQFKFCWKTPETLRKICVHLFCFPQLEHRRRQGEGGSPPPIVISPMTKMWQKSLLFLQF